MSRLTRRRMLQACGGLAAGSLAGCTSDAAPTDDPTQRHTCQTTPSSGRPDSAVYISEVHPNPEGADGNRLNDETVLLEVASTTDGTTDLSGHALVHCGAYVYEFPDDLSAVESGATLEVHTGEGEFGVDASAPPEYSLFVGRSEPLLSNDGMQLTVRSPDGEVLDSVRYPALDSGEQYTRPE